MQEIGLNQFSNIKNLDCNLKIKKSEKIKSATVDKKEQLSFGASQALKAQMLYQNSASKVYLQSNLSKKEIIKALKNKEVMGRSFFGYKSKVANIITKAEDSKLATENFNLLMNSKDKYDAADVTDILLVATSINNKKVDDKLMEEYGFNGGKLDETSIKSIFDKIKEQREEQMFQFMQQQMMQQQMLDQQMLQQQMMQQQMLNQQMMQQQMHQQMMMTTPGFGFC